jgi:dUTP pyrophosphatase
MKLFDGMMLYIANALERAKTNELTPGFKIHAEHPDLLPAYNKIGDSGFDLRAFIATDLVIQPGERQIISTGLTTEMPVGFELQVRPRSGMAAKFGGSVLNAPGTIDANYRGVIGVIFINHSAEPITIKPFERIAQGVITRVERINWEVVEAKDQLTETDRGEGGFGSSGKM